MPAPTLPHPASSRLLPLSLAALGVVYGDIGTSPLYAIRECFHGPHAVAVTRENVLGVLSLIFWSLVIVVTLKYIVYVIRADNRGEGGILALMALVRGALGRRRWRWGVIGVGLFGAALLYGDGIITPAISVLGAIEGLSVATPVFDPYVVPISTAILIGLFLFQRRGTAGVGAVFGPIMVVWFTTLAVLGGLEIARQPSVLAAANPLYGMAFFARNGLAGFFVLGSVFLVVTGGEALYADLGHFGERPMRIDWFTLVGPSLLLNYFGQGGLLLSEPEAAVSPFFRLAPAWALYPLVVLAAMAAIIASQAIISGAFSLTRQAVQLGYLPRVNVVHTSATEIGQIYIPGINWALMVATIGIVLAFRSSSNLANAYGVAVTTTMVVTTILAFVVTRKLWRWRLGLALTVSAAFLLPDLAFFSANILKVRAGGWFPLVVAAAVFLVMTTWQKGRALLADKLDRRALPVEDLLRDVEQTPVQRVPGTAVFLTGSAKGTPIALLHNFKHNKVLHERNLFLTVETAEIPYVATADRLRLQELGKGFWRLIASYGFMEDPDVPRLLAATQARGLEVDPRSATYVLSHNSLLPASRSRLDRWQQALFIFLARNAGKPTQVFRLPPGQVVELGLQVEV